jgi:hypothetical protein
MSVSDLNDAHARRIWIDGWARVSALLLKLSKNGRQPQSAHCIPCGLNERRFVAIPASREILLKLPE